MYFIARKVTHNIMVNGNARIFVQLTKWDLHCLPSIGKVNKKTTQTNQKLQHQLTDQDPRTAPAIQD